MVARATLYGELGLVFHRKEHMSRTKAHEHHTEEAFAQTRQINNMGRMWDNCTHE